MRCVIQEIALEHRQHYSYWRVTAELGLVCNVAHAQSDRSSCSTLLESIASPQGPVIEIATGLRLLQELPRIEDSVIRLEPDVTIHLPSRLSTRALAHEPRI